MPGRARGGTRSTRQDRTSSGRAAAPPPPGRPPRRPRTGTRRPPPPRRHPTRRSRPRPPATRYSRRAGGSRPSCDRGSRRCQSASMRPRSPVWNHRFRHDSNGLLGHSPVAAHQLPRLVRPDDDLSGLAGRDLVVGVIDDPHRVALAEPADAASRQQLQVPSRRRRAAELGHVEHDRGAQPEPLAERGRVVVRRRAEEHVAQRVVTVAIGRRELGDERRRGADQQRGSAAVAVDVAPELAGAEPVADHDLAVEHGRGVDGELAAHVEHRKRRVAHVVGGQVVPRAGTPRPSCRSAPRRRSRPSTRRSSPTCTG